MEHLRKDTRVFQSEAVERAFEKVDRANFVTDDYIVEAYEDYPLPIGNGQTISQPTTVAFMLEKLDPKPGNKVLDVGSGSGWTTALLAEMVGEKGEVFGVELVPELVEFGKENLSKHSYKNASIQQAEETLGLPEKGPFDRILVSASAAAVPNELLDQLAVGGILVIPVGDSIFRINKKTETQVDEEEFPGFVFVPLISQ